MIRPPVLLVGYGLSGVAMLVWPVVPSGAELGLTVPIFNGVLPMLLLLSLLAFDVQSEPRLALHPRRMGA